MEVSGSHVIMAIVPEQSEKVVPQILALAEENGLVCFDPQAGQVYLPPHLAAKQGGDTPPMAGSTPSLPKAECANSSSSLPVPTAVPAGE